jgi:hypothetical protein
VYLLPAREECIEAFQWLAQEVQQAKGDALVIHVQEFEGLTDSQIVELFRSARQQEYAEIEAQAGEVEQAIQEALAPGSAFDPETQQRLQEAVAKLRKRYSDILRIDFFDCPDSTQIAAHLLRLGQLLSPRKPDLQPLSASLAAYQNRSWVTRPRPFVDRLACAWLIRRFIDAHAVIRYSTQPEPGEIAFDMRDAEFGHQGNLCSFEMLMLRFGLVQPGLTAIARIVHELDLRDGQSTPPEAAGVEMVLRGWLLAGLSDSELEARGCELFEGLYTALAESKPLSD